MLEHQTGPAAYPCLEYLYPCRSRIPRQTLKDEETRQLVKKLPAMNAELVSLISEWEV